MDICAASHVRNLASFHFWFWFSLSESQYKSVVSCAVTVLPKISYYFTNLPKVVRKLPSSSFDKETEHLCILQLRKNWAPTTVWHFTTKSCCYLDRVASLWTKTSVRLCQMYFGFRSLQVLLISLLDQHFSEVVFRWFVYWSHRKFICPLYEKETYRITRTFVLGLWASGGYSPSWPHILMLCRLVQPIAPAMTALCHFIKLQWAVTGFKGVCAVSDSITVCAETYVNPLWYYHYCSCKTVMSPNIS
jgi:hypothetical protein